MSKDRFIVNDDMFGAYVKIPTGTSRDMHIYKVVGRIESNRYCDVPIMAEKRAELHSEIIPVLNVVHCGVSEDTIIRVALSDCEIVQTPNAPLTLDELREMGNDWMWIKLLVPIYRMETGYYLKNTRFSDTDKFFCGYPDIVVRELPYSGYGNIWLAYRRKPEEEAK